MNLSKAQSIFTFVECARTVTLSLNLRQLRLASWIPRGDLDEPGEGSAWRCPTWLRNVETPGPSRAR